MELNKANRQVCDVDIRILKTMQPFLDFETANTTTAGLSGDSVYAMAKGTRKIAFPNPIQGTMSIEAQVYPFKFFSLLSDGVIESTATYADKQTVAYNGLLDDKGRNRLIEFTIPPDSTIVSGTVFVYKKGCFGEEKDRIKLATFLPPKEREDGTLVQQISSTMTSITTGEEYEIGYLVTRASTYADKQVVQATEEGKISITLPADGTLDTDNSFVYTTDDSGNDVAIAGTWASNVFTATTTSDIAVGTEYKVGYIIKRTSAIQKISFNNNKLPQDYYITQKTLDKDEEGKLTPFVMTAYKATVQRNFELSFNSEGDPATVTLTFDLMEDKNGNIFDMVELTADAS